MEEGEVFEINGLNIGVVDARVHASPVGVHAEDRKATFQALKASMEARANPDTASHFELDPMNAIEPLPIEECCQKCKRPSELYEYEEEGLEYKVCALCALKAKIPMSRMRKL